jgi:hypothetical protein
MNKELSCYFGDKKCDKCDHMKTARDSNGHYSMICDKNRPARDKNNKQGIFGKLLGK